MSYEEWLTHQKRFDAEQAERETEQRRKDLARDLHRLKRRLEITYGIPYDWEAPSGPTA